MDQRDSADVALEEVEQVHIYFFVDDRVKLPDDPRTEYGIGARRCDWPDKGENIVVHVRSERLVGDICTCLHCDLTTEDLPQA
jgi:hypothetical protein